jgi:hypothetical protein
MSIDYNGFSRVEVMKILNCMHVFADACEASGVKFNKYTEEELFKILMMYRAWRQSGEPPF